MSVLVDLSHATEHALGDTFALLDEVDQDRTLPVVASRRLPLRAPALHAGQSAVEKIAERDGVIGLIFAQHQLTDGVRRGTRTLKESLEVLERHVERIREIEVIATRRSAPTSTAIKPTLGGLESMADMAAVERALETRYGAEDAAAISPGTRSGCCGRSGGRLDEEGGAHGPAEIPQLRHQERGRVLAGEQVGHHRLLDPLAVGLAQSRPEPRPRVSPRPRRAR